MPCSGLFSRKDTEYRNGFRFQFSIKKMHGGGYGLSLKKYIIYNFYIITII